MKKLIFALLALVFVTITMVSCSQSICPAYSSADDNTEQVEKNS
jgi:hypothetical protein